MSETRCIFVASDQPRALSGRHVPDCEGDCDGCLPCPERHCLDCGWVHADHAHPVTCPNCVGNLHGTLADIVRQWGGLLVTAMLGSNGNGLWAKPLAAAPIPGGDALVMLSPYGDGTADQRLRWSHVCAEHDLPVAATSHVHMESSELPGDPQSVLLVLAQWEDIWRGWLGHPGGPKATVPSAAGYLAEHLPRMAQALDRYGADGWEFAPDFGEFARDIRRIHVRLENVNHEGTRDERAGAPCFDCGGQLVRRYGENGRDDMYTCLRCRRLRTVAEYWLAVRAHAEEAKDGEAC